MQTLLALTDLVTAVASPAADIVLAGKKVNETGGEELASTIRDFIAPLFLLAIGIASMTFLFQRQMTQALQFAALAVFVAVFFYVPGIVENIARFVAAALGG